MTYIMVKMTDFFLLLERQKYQFICGHSSLCVWITFSVSTGKEYLCLIIVRAIIKCNQLFKHIVISRKDIEIINCDDWLMRNTKIIKRVLFRQAGFMGGHQRSLKMSTEEFQGRRMFNFLQVGKHIRE